MNYEKEYKRIVGKIKNAYLYAQTDSTKAVLEEIIPELAESEDEMVRKHLIALVTWSTSYSASGISNVDANKMLDWLEKQGEHANFRDKIQVGDKVTRNEAGVLVNLSQLKRVAKPSKRQGEQEKDILEDYILDGYILDGNEDGLIAETIRYKKEKQGEPIDKIVKRAMNEKQRVLLTETNGDANIDWDTRSLQDVKLLLEYGLDYIKKLEKQGKQKDSYTTIVETGNGGINALVTKELPTDGCDEEQKPADKVESHFHVEKGKWYMCIKNNVGITKGNAYYGISDGYIIDDNGRKYNCKNWAVFQGYLRLWDITIDARDGDVLYLQHDGKEHIIIYKGVIKERFRTFVSAYCAYNGIVDAFCFADVSRYADLAYGGIVPATKEQRDTLLKAMADAGYTFDFEKKMLKNIVQKAEENKGNVGGISDNPEWSEEDKNFMYDTLSNLTELKDRYGEGYGNVGKCIDWLRALRPQNIWNPSDEQIKVCKEVYADILSAKGFDLGTVNSELNRMEEQLKKLKEK